MSLQDFERCTPSEFKAVADAWLEHQRQMQRAEWERVRMGCLCSLQPYSKKQLQAADVMQFPWEKEEEEEKKQLRPSHQEIISRMEEAKRRWGLK